jgi:hypothetical protein
MKSTGAVLATALLLGACSYGGMYDFELELRSDAVKLKPVTEEPRGRRSHCSPADTKKNWC